MNLSESATVFDIARTRGDTRNFTLTRRTKSGAFVDLTDASLSASSGGLSLETAGARRGYISSVGLEVDGGTGKSISFSGGRSLMDAPDGDGRFRVSGDGTNYSALKRDSTTGFHCAGTEFAGDFHLFYNGESKAKVTATGLAIENSVTASGDLPATHKVAMVIGGANFYVLVSNA